jgi:uncharacterized YigZ family protein
MEIQSYKTLKNPQEFELKEKKSVFLAKAYPISAEIEVDQILHELKRKYYDASHHCYAYRLITGKQKFSDAGEPTGTAGVRILNAIDHFELKNCLIVVIRYFGGTKLGIGPLGKAYYKSTFQVLSKSNIVTKKPYLKINLELNLSSFDKLSRIISSDKIKVIETEYDKRIRMKCLIPFEHFEVVKAKIGEISRGKIDISFNDEIFFE